MLVLLGALIPAASLVAWAASGPGDFFALVTSGRVPWYSFLLPLMLVAAAVLLVRMSRWSFPLLALHLVLTFTYSLYRFGPVVFSSQTLLGYGLEGLAVVFSSYLGRTGKLR